LCWKQSDVIMLVSISETASAVTWRLALTLLWPQYGGKLLHTLEWQWHIWSDCWVMLTWDVDGTLSADVDVECLVLSCQRCERSSRQSQTVFNILETEQFCPVMSAVWTHLWTSLDPVSKYNVTTGNHVAWELETGLGQDKTQFTPHFGLDRTVLKFSVADSLALLPIQFTLSCRCSQCELNWQQGKTVCDWKFQNSFVQSEMRCELSLVLSVFAVWTSHITCGFTSPKLKYFAPSLIFAEMGRAWTAEHIQVIMEFFVGLTELCWLLWP